MWFWEVSSNLALHVTRTSAQVGLWKNTVVFPKVRDLYGGWASNYKFVKRQDFMLVCLFQLICLEDATQQLRVVCVQARWATSSGELSVVVWRLDRKPSGNVSPRSDSSLSAAPQSEPVSYVHGIRCQLLARLCPLKYPEMVFTTAFDNTAPMKTFFEGRDEESIANSCHSILAVSTYSITCMKPFWQLSTYEIAKGRGNKACASCWALKLVPTEGAWNNLNKATTTANATMVISLQLMGSDVTVIAGFH